MITADMVSKTEKERLKQHIEELNKIEDELFHLGGYDLNSVLCDIWSDLFALIEILEYYK